jgi:AcrR family transcriptional regulator
MVKIIENRDGRILDAALRLAEADGYQWITREGVAAMAGVSPGTINNVFGTMRGLKRAVLTEAVKRRIIPIVAQGLGDRHAIVMDAPADVRTEAATYLAGA